MGTPLSGLLVNIYAGHIENWALNSYFLIHIFWGGYMDYVVSLWNYGEIEFRSFLDNINTYDRNLQFTLEIETVNKISFPDVLIIRSLDKLNFTIYRKPTENKKYLNF